ncbi:MAG: TerB family tellurite resistance protein [Zoogloea sp.]|nr:TerB family tellurite resistance protein [Zoogloea sp.]
MRSYPMNSPEALARLVAMAILADGRLDNREVDWIKHNDTAALLGVDRDTLIQVLLDCCRDVINEAEQERVFLLEDHRLARLADDLTDPALQKVALSAMLILAKSDGSVSEGEETLLRFLMSRWSLSLEDLAAT